MTLEQINELHKKTLQEDVNFKYSWIVFGDGILNQLDDNIKKNNKNNRCILSCDFFNDVLRELTSKVNQIVQPIINVEFSYLERNGYLTSDSSECKEELLFKLKACIKQKYKLLETIVNNIVNGVIHGLFLMLNRLAEDIDLLGRLIKRNDTFVVGPVKWLGDSHFSGGSVMLVTLNNTKVIYKPRNLTCELFFKKIARKFGGCDYAIINCKNHGWAEFVGIDNTNINSNDLFYNAGRLQGLAYTLMLKDLHHENIKIIEHGFYVLDAECIFSTPIDFEKIGFNDYNNILDYLIIPVNVNLGKVSLRSTSVLARHIDNEMLKMEQLIIAINKFIEGFSISYTITMENKKDILRCIHEEFDNLKERTVIRSTLYYRQMMKILTHPKTLIMDKENACAELFKKFNKCGVPIEIIKSEIESILNGDIPYFYHKHTTGGVSDLHGNSFILPGNNVKKNILTSFLEKKISKADMQKQINLIKLFLDSEIQNNLHKR